MRKFISRMKKYRVKNLFLIVVLTLVLVTIFSSYSTTYAKYSTSASSTGQLQTASWVFTLNGSSATTQTITLESTTASNGNTKVVPDSTGSIELIIDYSEIETSFTYAIALSNVNLPTSLHIYTDSALTNELTTSSNLSGTLQVADFDASYEKDITLYWKWIDEDEDGDVDNTWENEDLSFDLTVSATQYIG